MLLLVDGVSKLLLANGVDRLLLESDGATSGGSWFRQRWNRSPLAYPAGAVPGIDLSHPAANGMIDGFGLSIIPHNGNFVDLLSGRIGQIGVAPSGTAIRSHIGRAPNMGATAYIDFDGQKLQTPTAITAGAIVQFDVTNNGSAYQALITPGLNTNAGILGLAPNGTFIIYINGNVASGFGVAEVGVPYFFAVSTDGTTANFVLTNLRTGATKQSTAGSNALGTTAGTCRIGDGAQGTQGTVAAAMYSQTFLSPSRLLRWSADPWAFWYPNKTINLASSAASAGASFLPVWAYRYNLPVLGTGNF